MAYGRHAAAAVDIFGQMYVLGGIGQGGVSFYPVSCSLFLIPLHLGPLFTPSVPLSLVSSVSLFPCLSVPLSIFFSFSLFHCLSVPLSLCSSVSLFLCHSVPLSLCSSVSLLLCLSVPLSLGSSVYLFLCLSVPLSLCSSVPLSLCSTVSLLLSFSCSLSLYFSVSQVDKETGDSVTQQQGKVEEGQGYYRQGYKGTERQRNKGPVFLSPYPICSNAKKS